MPLKVGRRLGENYFDKLWCLTLLEALYDRYLGFTGEGRLMDKLLTFFKNVWFRRAVSLICLGYTAVMVWLGILNAGYYFEVENPTPLFVLYLFMNICALGLLILSRKELLTRINSYLLPPIVFLTVIFALGNWYMIIPPVVVMVVLFFVNNSNETLKTVLGTMYLLMYVVGIVGFIGAQYFLGHIALYDVDLSERDSSYEKLSESGEYRIVRYFDTVGDRTVQSYYIETTENDVKIPLGTCKLVLGCKHIHTSTYEYVPEDLVKWDTRTVDGEKVEVLIVENVVRENPIEAEKREKEAEENSKSSSSAKNGLITIKSSTGSTDNSADV